MHLRCQEIQIDLGPVDLMIPAIPVAPMNRLTAHQLLSSLWQQKLLNRLKKRSHKVK